MMSAKDLEPSGGRELTEPARHPCERGRLLA